MTHTEPLTQEQIRRAAKAHARFAVNEASNAARSHGLPLSPEDKESMYWIEYHKRFTELGGIH